MYSVGYMSGDSNMLALLLKYTAVGEICYRSYDPGVKAGFC